MTAPSKRVNMRVSDEHLALIKAAAHANGQDMTSFVLGAALERARDTTNSLLVTRLSDQAYDELLERLDHDTEPNPTLVRAFERYRNDPRVIDQTQLDALVAPVTSHLPSTFTN